MLNREILKLHLTTALNISILILIKIEIIDFVKFEKLSKYAFRSNHSTNNVAIVNGKQRRHAENRLSNSTGRLHGDMLRICHLTDSRVRIRPLPFKAHIRARSARPLSANQPQQTTTRQ